MCFLLQLWWDSRSSLEVPLSARGLEVGASSHPGSSSPQHLVVGDVDVGGKDILTDNPWPPLFPPGIEDYGPGRCSRTSTPAVADAAHVHVHSHDDTVLVEGPFEGTDLRLPLTKVALPRLVVVEPPWLSYSSL